MQLQNITIVWMEVLNFGQTAFLSLPLWPDGSVARALDLQSQGCGFEPHWCCLATVVGGD